MVLFGNDVCVIEYFRVSSEVAHFRFFFLTGLSISLFFVIVPLLVVTSCLNPSDLAFLEVLTARS